MKDPTRIYFVPCPICRVIHIDMMDDDDNIMLTGNVEIDAIPDIITRLKAFMQWHHEQTGLQ